MIQNIEPHEYRNEYRPQPPEDDSILLYYEGRRILIRTEDDEIAFLTFGEAKKYSSEIWKNYTYLFSIDGQRYYLANGIDPDNFPEYHLEDKQYFRSARPKYRQFAALTGWQLYRWYQSRRYCGRCGELMIQDEKERMMRCPQCGLMEFPKICPAVIIGLTHGNKILMSKYAGREYKKYALLAGFNEIGESIEETVRREVMEEVGLKVKNIRYYKSQPWSFTDTLLLGFFCELDGDDSITLDQDELALAEWFEREKMPVKEEDLSLTNEMMMAFKNGDV
ncbi:NAD(+) diphosphatase [Faecalicatena contorta]|uniref:NAD(+) diphosphatase n=1 Tax=Faecalicatena contorta TaxID=39482 RepID=UPI001F22AC54|nr:NAD(+) diphosphatase [Faecalicatena contorta]MCF2681386.1 NAD(+) diphosphatase [Faecalicatena contorta]